MLCLYSILHVQRYSLCERTLFDEHIYSADRDVSHAHVSRRSYGRAGSLVKAMLRCNGGHCVIRSLEVILVEVFDALHGHIRLHVDMAVVLEQKVRREGHDP